MSASRFHIVDKLENGSQASVMNGIDLDTNKKVAIKIFDTQTENGKNAFYQETSAYQRIKKNRKTSKKVCVTIDSFSMDEKFGFIVMKKYECDLHSLKFNTEELTEMSIKKTFKKICEAVLSLHNIGVAHLDLKLENILIDSKGNPILCDFGCSFSVNKRKSLFERKGSKNQRYADVQRRGTKAYAAPEILHSMQHVNPFFADIYSLGVVLHVLLSGFFPDGCSLSPSLPQECKSFLAWMLESNPEERPSLKQILTHSWLRL